MQAITKLVVVLFLTSGCAIFKRSHQSGHGEKLTLSGWNSSKSGSDFQASTIRNLEASLSSRKEIEQYSRALPWFRDDWERRIFLSLSGYEERQQWLIENSFFNRPAELEGLFASVIESQDIAIGMPEPFVKRSWGEPSRIDVSGMPAFRNFRLRYQKEVPTATGYQSQIKTVFIESGRVAGWETE